MGSLMKVARSRSLRRRQLSVLIPIRTKFKIKKEFQTKFQGPASTNMLTYTAS